MGGKSDHTKYSTELPVLFALAAKDGLPHDFEALPLQGWLDSSKFSNPDKVFADIRKYLHIAVTPDFVSNFKKAQIFVTKIKQYMSDQGLPEIGLIDWQGNDNRNDNDSPADILFIGHPVGGISVKAGAPNLFNLGTKDLNFGNEKGTDLFNHLAPTEFTTLSHKVKNLLMDKLAVGDTWTDPSREGADIGKYAITRVSDNRYNVKYKKAMISAERNEILLGTYINSKGAERRIPKGSNRVFGDYYQKNKEDFVSERESLYKQLRPKLVEAFVNNIFNDPVKLSQLGGFTKQSYFFVDYGKNKAYFVPNLNDVKDVLKVEIVNKEKTFGAGLELVCSMRTKEDSEPATVEWHIRYHTGTFAGPPQNMIQNLANKENIWQTL
jgi:hypothetical protein